MFRSLAAQIRLGLLKVSFAGSTTILPSFAVCLYGLTSIVMVCDYVEKIRKILYEVGWYLSKIWFLGFIFLD